MNHLRIFLLAFALLCVGHIVALGQSLETKVPEKPLSKFGIYSYTELNLGGLLMGRYSQWGPNRYTGRSIGGTTETGIRLKRMLYLGAGLGIDFQDRRHRVPVFAVARYYLLPGKYSPYVALAGGYAFSSDYSVEAGNLQPFEQYDGVGGGFVNPSIGVRAFLRKVAIYHVGIGFRLLNDKVIGPVQSGPTPVEKQRYVALQLKLGAMF